MQKLYYIENNSGIPWGRVSSTARKGSKWNDLVNVGDVVALAITGTEEIFGEAVIVAKEVTTYLNVLNHADHNHVAFTASGDAFACLEIALRAAYGSLHDEDEFTVLHILPLNKGQDKDRESAHEQTERTGETLSILADHGVVAVEYTTHVGAVAETTRYELGEYVGDDE